MVAANHAHVSEAPVADEARAVFSPPWHPADFVRVDDILGAPHTSNSGNAQHRKVIQMRAQLRFNQQSLTELVESVEQSQASIPRLTHASWGYGALSFLCGLTAVKVYDMHSAVDAPLWLLPSLLSAAIMFAIFCVQRLVLRAELRKLKKQAVPSLQTGWNELVFAACQLPDSPNSHSQDDHHREYFDAHHHHSD